MQLKSDKNCLCLFDSLACKFAQYIIPSVKCVAVYFILKTYILTRLFAIAMVVVWL